jgi:hypothetical protein
MAPTQPHDQRTATACGRSLKARKLRDLERRCPSTPRFRKSPDLLYPLLTTSCSRLSPLDHFREPRLTRRVICRLADLPNTLRTDPYLTGQLSMRRVCQILREHPGHLFVCELPEVGTLCATRGASAEFNPELLKAVVERARRNTVAECERCDSCARTILSFNRL